MQRIQRKLQKNNIRFGLILPPLASFDPMGRSNNSRELQQIQQQLTNIPLLDLTPFFDINLPDTGVYLRLVDGMQQMVERPNHTVLAEGPQPKPPQSLASEIVAYFENHPNSEPLFFDGGHPDAEALCYSEKLCQLAQGFRMGANEISSSNRTCWPFVFRWIGSCSKE